MVGGEWLLRAGRWTTLDYRTARAELEAAHNAIRQRKT
jgi:hypothetical protein